MTVLGWNGYPDELKVAPRQNLRVGLRSKFPRLRVGLRGKK